MHVAEADVALLVDPADEPVRHTLSEAVQREGWLLAEGDQLAACGAVVWSQSSVTSSDLAARARPYLDRRQLLQILLQPKEWELGAPARIEPPEPFVYYQGLVVEGGEFDGSERAVDWFAFRLSDGESALAELARLGDLPRPRDSWNARITFYKPYRHFHDVRLVELASDDGRILRAWREYGREPLSMSFDTTIGNRWQVVDLSGGELLDVVEVGDEEVSVHLPQRDAWWRRVRRG